MATLHEGDAVLVRGYVHTRNVESGAIEVCVKAGDDVDRGYPDYVWALPSEVVRADALESAERRLKAIAALPAYALANVDPGEAVVIVADIRTALSAEDEK